MTDATAFFKEIAGSDEALSAGCTAILIIEQSNSIVSIWTAGANRYLRIVYNMRNLLEFKNQPRNSPCLFPTAENGKSGQNIINRKKKSLKPN